MSEKIIIENHTEQPMANIMCYVRYVIGNGRVSNSGKNCYISVFAGGIVVSAIRNKKSDRFVVSQR